jgi:GTP-binding protein
MPVVAIIGRPNVGKSTLFNRLIGERKAVTSERAGTTRDRIYGRTEWNGREFLLVDTGGLVSNPDTGIEAGVREQALLAVDEADVVLFLVDGRDEPIGDDEEVAARLRRLGDRSIVVANKVENERQEATAHLASRLGLGNALAVSALHGRGVGELLDAVAERLPPAEPVDPAAGIRLAVVGRPNVGKSSLVNALVGVPQVLVDSEPGTTRDAIDTRLAQGGAAFTLVDTAGLRRRTHVEDPIEYFASLRTLRTLESCDVALVVFDGTRLPEKQDLRIAGTPAALGKGIVLVINKWDIAERDEPRTAAEYRRLLPLQRWAPLLFVSAKSGEGVPRLLPAARAVHEQAERRIATSALTEAVQAISARRPPPGGAGGVVFATQVAVRPPTFVLFMRRPEAAPRTYVRYLENAIRDEYGFRGTPIRVILKQKKERKRDTPRDHWAS